MKLTSEWFAHKTAHFVEIDTKTLFIDIVSESIPCNSNDSCGFIPFRILTNWNSMCGLNEVKKQSVSAGNWNAVFFFLYIWAACLYGTSPTGLLFHCRVLKCERKYEILCDSIGWIRSLLPVRVLPPYVLARNESVQCARNELSIVFVLRMCHSNCSRCM